MEDLTAWNVGGHSPTNKARCFLPVANNAIEAAIDPSVSQWNGLIPVVCLPIL